jgi:hypothetical protein
MPTEEVPIVPHEGLGAETVRIDDPLPVEKLTPAMGTPTISDDDEQENESDEEDPGDKR